MIFIARINVGLQSTGFVLCYSSSNDNINSIATHTCVSKIVSYQIIAQGHVKRHILSQYFYEIKDIQQLQAKLCNFIVNERSFTDFFITFSHQLKKWLTKDIFLCIITLVNRLEDTGVNNHYY